MDNHLIALYDFHGMFFHVVVWLSLSNKFLSHQWLPYVSINMISTLSWYESEDLRDWAQAFSNVFSANKRRVHSFEPLTDLATNTQCSLDFVKFIVNICEQTTNFHWQRRFLDFLFFPEVMLEIGGAAYTQVQLIHESLR